jgi:UDP-N-acetylglucosamine 1-carboxyvinyltransferase
MNKMVIRGGQRLNGRVKVNGAKNAVLPIIAAAILASEGESYIGDTPPLDDVNTIIQVLESLGIRVRFKDGTVYINATELQGYEPPYELIRKMRASFLVMGPLLARLGCARIALPGGCAIGTRPIDQHLKGFEMMGAEIDIGQGFIEARTNGAKLQGAKIYLDIASVGATENIMMAATLAKGTTVIDNAAKEPEIVDLANYLNAMGARVRGAGTDCIRIEGVSKLKGVQHQVIPDRVEAGTYMIAAAITKGDIYIEGAISDHLAPVISKLQEMGAIVETDENGIRVHASGTLKSVDIKTLPYPGFPTDMQAQMMALLLTSDGTSIITETVFENRFMHVDEFRRMSAEITVDGRAAMIKGNHSLQGAKMNATDLRAGAALILASLAAEGESEIMGLHHLDRGYVDIVGKLRQLGADITRTEVVTIEETREVKLFTTQISPSLA